MIGSSNFAETTGAAENTVLPYPHNRVARHIIHKRWNWMEFFGSSKRNFNRKMEHYNVHTGPRFSAQLVIVAVGYFF